LLVVFPAAGMNLVIHYLTSKRELSIRKRFSKSRHSRIINHL